MIAPPTRAISLRDRYLGALLGLAAGDAVGTTLEFQPRGSFAPIADMVGGGPFSLPAGAWTDEAHPELPDEDAIDQWLAAAQGLDALQHAQGFWAEVFHSWIIGRASRRPCLLSSSRRRAAWTSG